MKRQTSKTDDAISMADDFCKRVRDRELVITPEADSIKLVLTKGKSSLGREKKREYSLAFLIGKRMTEYQSTRDSTQDESRIVRAFANSRIRDEALRLLEVIDLANTHGVIREENLTDKLTEYEKQNKQLKEENDKLRKENQRLKKLTEALHKALSRFGKVGNIGNVSGVEDE